MKCKYVEIVELMLRDKWTEPNVKDNAYNTPMMHAVKKNQVDCVKVLLSDPRVDLDCGLWIARRKPATTQPRVTLSWQR